MEREEREEIIQAIKEAAAEEAAADPVSHKFSAQEGGYWGAA